MAGVIYKITNPNNKIYIGCTIDFKRRLSEYRRLSMVGQVKLYNSLVKYGFDNHVFEIIEECSNDTLHEREIYWIKYFNCIKEGLNIRLGNRTGALMESTKQKISKALKGRKITWKSKGPKDYKYTEEQKQKMRKPRINKWRRLSSINQDTIENIRELYNTGNYTKTQLHLQFKLSQDTIRNIVDRRGIYE